MDDLQETISMAWLQPLNSTFRVPALLHPSLILRYVFFSFATLYISCCFLLRVPLFSSNLPPYTGPYNVGTIDIEAPCERRKIDNAVHKSTSQPAFELETILFSVYYPAAKESTSSEAKHPWISKPVSATAEGYARFAQISNHVTNNIFTLALWTLVGGLRIPANVDVPLCDSSNSSQGSNAEGKIGSGGFPVVVFSHGMASSRTDYTHWCAELASRGYVVAAIEHRDGSCPGSIVIGGDGSTRNVLPIRADQLRRDPPMDTAGLKETQLNFRQVEVEETVRVLRSINDGHGGIVYKSNLRNEGRCLVDWQGQLDLDRITMAGHSYGATLALQALKNAPSEKLPFKGGIMLDPGKQSGALNHIINVPILVVHSNSWSRTYSIFQGRPHFEVIKDLVQGVLDRGKAAWFVTSLETAHPSVTDAPLIEPLLFSWTTGATIDVKEGLRQYVHVTSDFLEFLKRGEKRGILKETVTHPDYNHDLRNEKRKREMSKDIARYWQIHIAPDLALVL